MTLKQSLLKLKKKLEAKEITPEQYNVRAGDVRRSFSLQQQSGTSVAVPMQVVSQKKATKQSGAGGAEWIEEDWADIEFDTTKLKAVSVSGDVTLPTGKLATLAGYEYEILAIQFQLEIPPITATTSVRLHGSLVDGISTDWDKKTLADYRGLRGSHNWTVKTDTSLQTWTLPFYKGIGRHSPKADGSKELRGLVYLDWATTAKYTGTYRFRVQVRRGKKIGSGSTSI